MSEFNRRGFLKGALVALAALPVVKSFIGEAVAADAEVDKTKGMAKTLKYVSNAATECAGGKCAPKFKDGSQCSKCSFYKQIDGTKGSCTLVKPGFVQATGWCTSFNKKAGA